jgi:DNA-binding MarR family transcriptional regulator
MSDNLRSLGDLDRLLHEPARLMIATILFSAAEADFLYLLNATGLTRGNLSTHLARLEEAGYVEIEKTYKGKLPRTICRLTDAGRTAFDDYRKQLREIVETLEGRDEKRASGRLLAQGSGLDE